jgi:lipase ATG15
LSVAYEDQENAQPLLDIWFGEGYLIDESEFVSEYRMQKGSHLIPVWYKLFRLNTTTTDQTAGIVAVRGTESKIDWLVNMQLWLSSGMAEIVKNIVPFGFVFEPIIDDMVTVVNVIQSESLKKVSYYSEVARFCRDILDQGFYDQLRLTGASLGGGTAMIAGAQTKVLTVAISGTMLVVGLRSADCL